MAFIQVVSLICLLVGISSAAISSASHDQSKDNSVTETPWLPATEPRDFSYNIMDGIQGANQLRQESWKDGVMRGMYSIPLGDNKWQVVNYVADDKGYRVESTKILTESELMSGKKAETDTAHVDISQDGEKTAYKVTADEISPKAQDLKGSSHKVRRGVYEAQQEAAKAVMSGELSADEDSHADDVHDHEHY